MPDQTETWDGTERRDRPPWLTRGEIRAEIHDVIGKELSEQRQILERIADAGQTQVQQGLLLLGDKKLGIRGMLPSMISRQRRLIQRQDVLEEKTAVWHAENQQRAADFESRVQKELQKVRKEVRAVRRNQHRWYARVWTWCMTKDESDKYSRRRIAVLLSALATAATYLKLVWPKLIDKAQQVGHVLFR